MSSTSGMVLCTLGASALTIGADGEPILHAGKGLGLLVLLALTPGRRLSRDVLIEMLWSDAEPDRARNALRQALWSLRRSLGEEAITGAAELVLARPLVSDRDTFLTHVEAGRLQEAITAYTGPFLPAFGMPGGAAFEQWADLERRRLETTFVRTAELLVGRLLAEGRGREAVAMARRVRERAADSEAARRLVLDTAVAARDVVTAAVEAEAIVAWATALDLPLEPSTQRAVAAARQVTPAPSGPAEARDDRGLVSELIGRESEFAAIVQAWEHARQGTAQSVRIEGRAGFGKSRLLQDVADRLRQRGARVVAVGGGAADRELPFAFLGDLAAALAECRGASGIAPGSAATLVAINPALSARYPGPPDSASGDELMSRCVHALGDLVQAIADERPLALCIDDLHWIDGRSRHVLLGLISRLGRGRVLVCLAGRPEGGVVVPANLSLTLPPLAASQVHDLVASIGGLPDATWSARLVTTLAESSGGSPLLVLESLRLALDRGVLRLEEGAWRCPDEPALPRLLAAGEALRERLRPLDAAASELVELLSLHGAPLTVDQLEQALPTAERGVAHARVPALLHQLERQGLVVLAGGRWAIAHDEIARVVLEETTASRQATLSGRLAEVLLAAPELDAVGERRAARHLLASGESAALHRAFRGVVERHRSRGDQRAHHQLARDWLGTQTGDPLVTQLVSRLPLSWRLGLWSGPRRMLAAALLAVVSAGGWVAWRSADAHRRGSPQLVYVDTARRAWTATVDDAVRSDGALAVPLTSGRPASLAMAVASLERPPAISPDGRSVAWSELSPDSTTIDIWLRTPTGTRRLTQRARDDVAVEWLPDGSALLGLSNQWSPQDLGSYDVAIIDTATGAARPLTRGPEHEGMPRASPDGLRVAYQRESAHGDRMLCVLSRFATGDDAPRCLLVQGIGVTTVIGWTSTSEVLVIVDSGTVQPVVRVDVDRDVTTTIRRGFALAAQLSPDRRWLQATMSVDQLVGVREWVMPVAAPQEARQVRSPRPLLRSPWWEGPMDTSGVVRRLVFADSVSTIAPGVRSQLRVQALARDGLALPLTVPVHWWSSDTTVAVVDSAGELRGLRRGTVRITAALSRDTPDVRADVSGPTLAVSRVIRVEAVPLRPLMAELWSADWRERWISFGEPAPSVVRTAGGDVALAPNGDGVYKSFVLQRAEATAEGGLGVELRLSTPITRTTWQAARAALVSVPDTASFASAAQDGPSPDFDGSDVRCGIAYPAPGMGSATRRLVVTGGVGTWVDLGALGDTLASGDWWTLRLQLLPDGRCGIAVNGRVVWVSPEPLDVRRPRRLRLGDESVGTRILFGALRSWRGVQPDLDWNHRGRRLARGEGG